MITKGAVIITDVLTIASLAGAIAINVLAQYNCTFVIGASELCSEEIKICCKCCTFSKT